MKSVLELFILRWLESIQNFMSSTQCSMNVRVVAYAEILLAKNDNLIVWSCAYLCNDLSAGTMCLWYLHN